MPAAAPAGLPRTRETAPDGYRRCAGPEPNELREPTANRPDLAEAFGGLADPGASAAEGVRVVERVEEHVRRGPYGQRLPGGQSYDGGHRLSLATDNRALSARGLQDFRQGCPPMLRQPPTWAD